MAFKFFAHREAQQAKRQRPDSATRAKKEMFERDHEQHDVEQQERPGREEGGEDRDMKERR